MKRSCSAPMISEMAEAGIRPQFDHSRPLYCASALTNLTVDTGVASASRPLLSSPGRLSSPTQPRVLQLKVESSTDEGKKEIIHERGVTNSLTLNHYLDGCSLGDRDSTSDAMDLCLTPPATGPGMQFMMSPSDHTGMLSVSASAASVRSRSLTPTSPSPTRRSSFSSYTCRGSVSPLRPSSLSLGKRKREAENEEMDTMEGSAKRHLAILSPVNSGGSSCSSPIAATSPLHHSFSIPSHQRSSMSSTSSSCSNPFILSASHSISDVDNSASVLRMSPSIHISDTSKACDMDNSPTPLSPRGIKFHQKNTFLSTLPSPVPKPKAVISDLPVSTSSLTTSSQSIIHTKFHQKLSISSRRKLKTIQRSSFSIPNQLLLSSPDSSIHSGNSFNMQEQRSSDLEDSTESVEHFPHSPLMHSQQADDHLYSSREANLTSSPLMHNSSFATR